MDEQEILNRFKRQQGSRRTRFHGVNDIHGQISKSGRNQIISRTVATPTTSRRPESNAQPPASMKSSRNAVMIITLIIGILGIAGGGFAITKWRQSKSAKALAAAHTAPSDVSIALYYPQNLPAGYTYNNDQKTLKTNVLYYSVNGPNKDTYHVTQQPIPASFDFVAFNKKFLDPDTFNAGSGSVTAGPVGANLLGSIRTNKNTWIIVNSSGNATLGGLETVTRSFEAAN